MTFIEYLVRKYMGEPDWHKGEWRWRCPWCKKRGFHVRPHKQGCKDRAACWACDAFCDERDLVQMFEPKNKHIVWRLEQLEEEHANSSPGDRGQAIIKSLLRTGDIDIYDILDAASEVRHKMNMRYEWSILGRRGKN